MLTILERDREWLKNSCLSQNYKIGIVMIELRSKERSLISSNMNVEQVNNIDLFVTNLVKKGASVPTGLSDEKKSVIGKQLFKGLADDSIDTNHVVILKQIITDVNIAKGFGMTVLEACAYADFTSRQAYALKEVFNSPQAGKGFGLAILECTISQHINQKQLDTIGLILRTPNAPNGFWLAIMEYATFDKMTSFQVDSLKQVLNYKDISNTVGLNLFKILHLIL